MLIMEGQPMIMSYPELARFKKCTLSLTDTFSAARAMVLVFSSRKAWRQAVD
jgi:hypothetical protein